MEFARFAKPMCAGHALGAPSMVMKFMLHKLFVSELDYSDSADNDNGDEDNDIDRENLIIANTFFKKQAVNLVT